MIINLNTYYIQFDSSNARNRFKNKIRNFASKTTTMYSSNKYLRECPRIYPILAIPSKSIPFDNNLLTFRSIAFYTHINVCIDAANRFIHIIILETKTKTDFEKSTIKRANDNIYLKLEKMLIIKSIKVTDRVKPHKINGLFTLCDCRRVVVVVIAATAVFCFLSPHTSAHRWLPLVCANSCLAGWLADWLNGLPPIAWPNEKRGRPQYKFFRGFLCAFLKAMIKTEELTPKKGCKKGIIL